MEDAMPYLKWKFLDGLLTDSETIVEKTTYLKIQQYNVSKTNADDKDVKTKKYSFNDLWENIKKSKGLEKHIWKLNGSNLSKFDGN